MRGIGSVCLLIWRESEQWTEIKAHNHNQMCPSDRNTGSFPVLLESNNRLAAEIGLRSRREIQNYIFKKWYGFPTDEGPDDVFYTGRIVYHHFRPSWSLNTCTLNVSVVHKCAGIALQALTVPYWESSELYKPMTCKKCLPWLPARQEGISCSSNSMMPAPMKKDPIVWNGGRFDTIIGYLHGSKNIFSLLEESSLD